MKHELTKTRRNLILMTACISTFMATLDGSIVNISLPVISEYFSASINTVQWIVTAYLLTITAILLIWGKISDIYGRKYLFAAGLAVFTIGSVLCGLSGSLAMLVFARILQAIGASITMALVQGIVTSIFPATERGKALGVVGTVVAIGGLVGPSLGGLLVHSAGWRSIFFINIPFGTIGVILTLLLLPETDVKASNRVFDVKGSIIFILAITLLFIGLLSLTDSLVSQNVMLAMIFTAIILFAVFIRYEKRQANPLLDLDLFKNATFSISLMTAYISYLSMFAYIFFMPFYLQYVLGLNILTAGLLMSVYPITTGILSPISGWISDQKSQIPLTLIGLALNTGALAMLAFMNETSPTLQVASLIMMLAVGSALFQAPNNSYIMGSVSRDKLGVAGSITALFRNVGMVSGTTFSVMLFIFVTRMGISNMTGAGFDSALFLKGFRVVMLSASAVSFMGVAISAYRQNMGAGAAASIESVP